MPVDCRGLRGSILPPEAMRAWRVHYKVWGYLACSIVSAGASRSPKAWLEMTAIISLPKPDRAGILVDDQDLTGFAHTFQDYYLIPGYDRAQIQNPHTARVSSRRSQGRGYHASPGDQRDFVSFSQDRCFTKGQAILVAGVRGAAFSRVQQGPVLKKESWIIPPQRTAQQADCICSVAGKGDPPARQMGEDSLSGDAMPGITGLFPIADRDAHHDWSGESVGSAPAQTAQVADLFVSRIGIFTELDLWYRQ